MLIPSVLKMSSILFSVGKTRKFSVYSSKTLKEMGLEVLNSHCAYEKTRKTVEFVKAWQSGSVPAITREDIETSPCPLSFARPVINYVEVDDEVATEDQKRFKKIMKKFSTSIEYTIHGIANAESYAIDLFWDLIVRFTRYNLPVEFYDDMIYIVNQEAQHFLSWDRRLIELKCPFGSLPVNVNLWKDAERTADDLLARLAIINLTHEAKGLDGYAKLREKLLKSKDTASVAILDVNYREEIGHVSFGLKWFKYLCKERGLNEVEEFHRLSRLYFIGKLKAPFDKAARDSVGMTEEYYIPLT